jgi:hypothetical protein
MEKDWTMPEAQKAPADKDAWIEHIVHGAEIVGEAAEFIAEGSAAGLLSPAAAAVGGLYGIAKANQPTEQQKWLEHALFVISAGHKQEASAKPDTGPTMPQAVPLTGHTAPHTAPQAVPLTGHTAPHTMPPAVPLAGHTTPTMPPAVPLTGHIAPPTMPQIVALHGDGGPGTNNAAYPANPAPSFTTYDVTKVFNGVPMSVPQVRHAIDGGALDSLRPTAPEHSGPLTQAFRNMFAGQHLDAGMAHSGAKSENGCGLADGGLMPATLHGPAGHAPPPQMQPPTPTHNGSGHVALPAAHTGLSANHLPTSAHPPNAAHNGSGHGASPAAHIGLSANHLPTSAHSPNAARNGSGHGASPAAHTGLSASHAAAVHAHPTVAVHPAHPTVAPHPVATHH